MEYRLTLVALLAFASGQVIAGATTATPGDDDEATVSVFIPLPDSYNMTTQWLAQLRDSYLQIIRFEANQRLQNARQVASNVRLMSDPYKQELDELVAKVVMEENKPCVAEKVDRGLQVFQGIDEKLKDCSQLVVDMIERYDAQLNTILNKVSAQDEAEIYSKCLPTESKLTRKILDRSEKCFREEYSLAVTSIYYPTGLELFTLVSEMTTTFLKVELSANICGIGVVDSQDEALTKIHEDIRQCAPRVAMPHSRQRRGFGKKLRKAWKKVRNEVKRFCGRVPCQVGYSIPLPGK